MADSEALKESDFEMKNPREKARKDDTASGWDASAELQLNSMLKQLPDLEEEHHLAFIRKPLLPPSVPILNAPSGDLIPPAEDDNEEVWMQDTLRLIEQGDIGSWLNDKLVDKNPASGGELEEEEESSQRAGPSRRSQRISRKQPSSETLTESRRSLRLISGTKRTLDKDDALGLISDEEDEDEDEDEGDEEKGNDEECADDVVELTVNNLMKYLHLPIKTARHHFGIRTSSVFKAALGNLGITRWPHRQYMCLQNLLSILKGDPRKCYKFEEKDRSKLIAQIKDEFIKLSQSPSNYELPSNLKVVSKDVSRKKYSRSQRLSSKQRAVSQTLAGKSLTAVLDKLIEKRSQSSQVDSLVPQPPPLSGPIPGMLAPPPFGPNAWPQEPQQTAAMQQLAVHFHSQIDDQIRLLQSQQQRILISSGLIPFFSNPSLTNAPAVGGHPGIPVPSPTPQLPPLPPPSQSGGLMGPGSRQVPPPAFPPNFYPFH